MPHVIVKVWPGKSEHQKQKMAAEIVQAVMSNLDYGRASVSVSIEEIAPKDWGEKVFKPDILNGEATLYEKPGYELADFL